jgi:hypothetical protein
MATLKPISMLKMYSILALKNVTIINVSHVKIKENLVKYDIIYSVNNKAVKVLK